MKYYTPKIEEFHVGFECEGLVTEHGFQGWSEIEITDSKRLIEILQPWDKNPYDEFRVKCLDEQDILDLGWEKVEIKTFPTYEIEKKEDGFNCYSKYTLLWTGRVDITSEYFSSWGGSKERFSIAIQNKSELAKLMQLNIL